MEARDCGQPGGGVEGRGRRSGHGSDRPLRIDRRARRRSLSAIVDDWSEVIAPCPWSAHIGLSTVATHTAWSDQATLGFRLRPQDAGGRGDRTPLYTADERRRRDASPWTIVQGVLAPVQFLACAVSLALIARYLVTGQGYGLATASILVKTVLLYAIMITGSIWEKAVFGKWLFARAFFWEDVVSMGVLALQTAYLGSLLLGIGTPAQQMTIAVAAYAAYAINASQFLLKLRAARLEAAGGAGSDLAGLAA